MLNTGQHRRKTKIFCESDSLLDPKDLPLEVNFDLKTSKKSYEMFTLNRFTFFYDLFVLNVIKTGQHWKNPLIFAATELFLGPTSRLQCGDYFDKMSDKSRKAWFIPLGHFFIDYL